MLTVCFLNSQSGEKKKKIIRDDRSSKATVLDLVSQQEYPVQQASQHHIFGHNTDIIKHVSVQFERLSQTVLGVFGRQSAMGSIVMQGSFDLLHLISIYL